jgi:hypothetical protein
LEAFAAAFGFAAAVAAVARLAAVVALRAVVVAFAGAAAFRAGLAALVAPATLPRAAEAVFRGAFVPAASFAAAGFVRFTGARLPGSAASGLLDRAGGPAVLPPRERDTVFVLAK